MTTPRTAAPRPFHHVLPATKLAPDVSTANNTGADPGRRHLGDVHQTTTKFPSMNYTSSRGGGGAVEERSLGANNPFGTVQPSIQGRGILATTQPSENLTSSAEPRPPGRREPTVRASSKQGALRASAIDASLGLPLSSALVFSRLWAVEHAQLWPRRGRQRRPGQRAARDRVQTKECHQVHRRPRLGNLQHAPATSGGTACDRGRIRTALRGFRPRIQDSTQPRGWIVRGPGRMLRAEAMMREAVNADFI